MLLFVGRRRGSGRGAGALLLWGRPHRLLLLLLLLLLLRGPSGCVGTITPPLLVNTKPAAGAAADAAARLLRQMRLCQ